VTVADRGRLAARLLGTCDTLEAGLDSIGLLDEVAVDDAEDALLDASVERCLDCGWWHESCELDNERDGEAGYCDQCEPKPDAG
jgi:hypothetical protein